MVSIDSWRAASMKAQVLTTTRSACLGGIGRLEAVPGEGPDQLVRVDLVLRAAQRLDPVPLGHQDNLPGSGAAKSSMTAQRSDRSTVATRPAARRRAAGDLGISRTPTSRDTVASAVPESGHRAEREGFEPSDPVSQVNSLAVSPIRPLSHLSMAPGSLSDLHPGGVHGRTIRKTQGYRKCSQAPPRWSPLPRSLAARRRRR